MRFAPAAALACLLLAPPAGAESFASWRAKAEKARKAGDASAALEAYAAALRLWKPRDGKPSKAKVLAGRADLLDTRGDAAGALRDLSAALEADPKSAALFHRRGRLRAGHGEIDSAISDFYKATSLNLGFAQAYLDRGSAYERKGDMAFAKEDYRTACRLGLKAACTEESRAKARAEEAAKAREEFAEGAPSEASGPVEIRRPSDPRDYALDWNACRSGLARCLDHGGSFGLCVRSAPVCEARPARGCCPKDCLSAYEERAAQVSEAAAYREVFAPKSRCQAPGL